MSQIPRSQPTLFISDPNSTEWAIKGPRPILIGPFPSKQAARVWDSEWRSDDSGKATFIPIKMLGTTYIHAPGAIAGVILAAQRHREGS